MAVALLYALHYNSGGHDKIAIRPVDGRSYNP
jgi:hypothetical protein